jgi:hypothetical protein
MNCDRCGKWMLNYSVLSGGGKYCSDNCHNLKPGQLTSDERSLIAQLEIMPTSRRTLVLAQIYYRFG